MACIWGLARSFALALFLFFGALAIALVPSVGDLALNEMETLASPAVCQLSVVSPAAQQYNYSSIELNYTTNASSVSYSLDSGPGIPLSGNTTVSFPAGSHSLLVYATDGCVGNASVNFSIDLSAPAAPVLEVAPATRVASYAVRGIAEPNSTVTIMLNSASAGTAAAASNGSFSKTITLLQGNNTVSAYATDGAGNRGSQSQDYAILLDSLAALHFSVPDYAQENRLAVSGTAEQGATLAAYLNGEEIASGPSNGSFSFEFQLRRGNNSINITASDALGNFANGAGYCFYDPDRPRISSFSPADGSSVATRNVAVSAECEDSQSGVNPASVALLVDDYDVGANYSSGTVSAALELGDGAHVASVSCADMAGNAASARWSFNIDTSIADAPTGFYVTDADGSARLVWSVVPEAVEYMIYRSENQDGLVASLPIASLGENFYLDASLAPGNYYYTVRAVDSAGNLGQPAAPVLYVKRAGGVPQNQSQQQANQSRPATLNETISVRLANANLALTRALVSANGTTHVSATWKNIGATAAENLELSEFLPMLAAGSFTGIAFSPEPFAKDASVRAATWRVASLAPGGEFAVRYSVPVPALSGFSQSAAHYAEMLGAGMNASGRIEPQKENYSRDIDVSKVWVDTSDFDLTLAVPILILVALSGTGAFGAAYFLFLRKMD